MQHDQTIASHSLQSHAPYLLTHWLQLIIRSGDWERQAIWGTIAINITQNSLDQQIWSQVYIHT